MSKNALKNLTMCYAALLLSEGINVYCGDKYNNNRSTFDYKSINKARKKNKHKRIK